MMFRVLLMPQFGPLLIRATWAWHGPGHEAAHEHDLAQPRTLLLCIATVPVAWGDGQAGRGAPPPSPQ